MSEFLSNLGLSPEWVVFFGSMIPFIELRGAIPIGIEAGIPWYWTYLIAVIGNMLPVPIILFFLEWAIKILSRISFFKKFFDWLYTHTESKAIVVQKYKKIGLTLFVAVPLPVTGAWTASVAALIFGIKPITAFIFILIGVMMSGVIVTILSLMGWVGALIAGIALAILLIVIVMRSKQKKKAEKTAEPEETNPSV